MVNTALNESVDISPPKAPVSRAGVNVNAESGRY